MIQQGRTDLLPELWEQVRRFVALQAMRRYSATRGMGGVEVDDLIQSGYIALVEAVKEFDGEHAFLTWLKYYLTVAFQEAEGCRGSRQRNDPLHHCVSLDAPLDDDDGDTLMDIQADTRDDIADVEHRLWLEKLRVTLERALDELPTAQRETLERRFYRGETLQQIGAAWGVSAERVRQQEYKAKRYLRRHKVENGLGEFLDVHTPFYARVGVAAYNTTRTSAVEMAVLEREKWEGIYHREDITA